MTDTNQSWVARAADAKLELKVNAVADAAYTLADSLDREVSTSEMIAAAFREAINQCQNGQGQIQAADLYSIAGRLQAVEPTELSMTSIAEKVFERAWAVPFLRTSERTLRKQVAAALQAMAAWVDHDWSAFECIDAIIEVAAEIEEGTR